MAFKKVETSQGVLIVRVCMMPHFIRVFTVLLRQNRSSEHTLYQKPQLLLRVKGIQLIEHIYIILEFKNVIH